MLEIIYNKNKKLILKIGKELVAELTLKYKKIDKIYYADDIYYKVINELISDLTDYKLKNSIRTFTISMQDYYIVHIDMGSNREY